MNPRPETTTQRIPGFGTVAVARPTMPAIRRALRQSGVTTNRMEIRRCKGKRVQVIVTPVSSLELELINEMLDAHVPFGIRRTFAAGELVITLQRPR